MDGSFGFRVLFKPSHKSQHHFSYAYIIRLVERDNIKVLIIYMCRYGRGRLFAQEVCVRHSVRVQLDVLRPDSGTGNTIGRQVRSVHVFERRKSDAQEQRVFRAVSRLPMVWRRDRCGCDNHVPNHSRFRGRVHRLGGHQCHGAEPEHPTQSSQVSCVYFMSYDYIMSEL